VRGALVQWQASVVLRGLSFVLDDAQFLPVDWACVAVPVVLVVSGGWASGSCLAFGIDGHQEP